jgi:iron-sulfur cluster repair protein YtfE (RIC family)
MTARTMTHDEVLEQIRTQPIRSLVESFPLAMPVLDQHGFDLCCGGGHTVPEAARLHGLDAEALVQQVLADILQAGE